MVFYFGSQETTLSLPIWLAKRTKSEWPDFPVVHSFLCCQNGLFERRTRNSPILFRIALMLPFLGPRGTLSSVMLQAMLGLLAQDPHRGRFRSHLSFLRRHSVAVIFMSQMNMLEVNRQDEGNSPTIRHALHLVVAELVIA